MAQQQTQFADQSYSSIYGTLSDFLSSNEVFNNQLPSDFSSKLLGVLSTALTSLNYYTDRKVQEAYLSTAQSPYSVLNGAMSQIGTLMGSSPSVATISYQIDMTNPLSAGGVLYTLPPFTLFTIDGNQFYTPSEVVIDSSVTTTGSFSLVEGTLNTKTFTSDGSKFQKFYVSSGFLSGQAIQLIAMDSTSNVYSEWTQVDSLIEDSFSLSDNTSTGGTLTKVPLQCYQTSIYPDGSLCILFGDNEFGAVPPYGTKITVNYFECSQGALNSSYLPGSAPKAIMTSSPTLDDNNIKIFNTLMQASCPNIYGGSPARSYSFYKNFAPRLAASKQRVVGPDDLAASLMNYTFGISNLKPIKGCNVLVIKNKNHLNNTMTPLLLMDTDLYNNPDFKADLSSYLTRIAVPCVITPVLAPVSPFRLTVDVLYLDSTYSHVELTTIITSIIQSMIPIQTQHVVGATPKWDMSNASDFSFGTTYYLQDFYSNISNKIGLNKVSISYNYNNGSGNSTDKVDPGENSVLGLDFTQTLLGSVPITINFV